MATTKKQSPVAAAVQSAIAPVAPVAPVTSAAPAIVILPDDMKAATAKSAAEFAASDTAAESSARGLYFLADVTYGQWEAVRLQWGAAYSAARPGITQNAIDKAWQRVLTLMAMLRSAENLPYIAKPAAPSKASVEMAEKRAAEKAKVDALKVRTLPELAKARQAAFDTAAAALKGGDVDAADAAKAEAVFVQKAIDTKAKEAGEAAKAKAKEVRARLTAIIAHVGDVEMLAKIETAIRKLISPETLGEALKAAAEKAEKAKKAA